MPKNPGIKELNFLPRFKKAFSKLDRRIQEEAEDAIKDLRKAELPNGRNLEKLPGYRNPEIYSIRINYHYRLSFHLEGGTAFLRNIASHDQLYGNP